MFGEEKAVAEVQSASTRGFVYGAAGWLIMLLLGLLTLALGAGGAFTFVLPAVFFGIGITSAIDILRTPGASGRGGAVITLLVCGLGLLVSLFVLLVGIVAIARHR